ncbi:MAG: hypothetical protein KDB90_15315 [Planctomycetes bacterium]|nr:hypothetical protein [Planctomycetota bacterium]
MTKLLAVLAVMVMFSGALAAQQDIDVEYPIGTSVASGSSIDLGDHADKSPYNLTIRITNAGTTNNLVLDTSSSSRPCTCSGATRVNWLVTQPLTTTLAPGAFIDFTLDLTPNDKGKWNVFLYIYSDDPDSSENPYAIRFNGTAGKAKKDESCSTNEGGNFGFLILLGAISALGVGLRMRSSRA